VYLDFENFDVTFCEQKFSQDYYFQSVLDFLKLFSESDSFTSNTSGSTGIPKLISIDKSKAIESARLSNEFFGITNQTKFLHCLDNKYIGSKMMLIRASLAQAKVLVIKPSLDFFTSCDDESIDFISLTPLHVERIIHSRPQFFDNIKTCLIGASGVSSQLEKEILGIKAKTTFFESFAMTETLSHFALRNISAKEKSFRLLNGFFISVNSNQGLQVQHDLILTEGVATNDIVNIEADGTFTFIGRLDNVINTGGIKISPENIEREWGLFLPFKFILAGENDTILGQKLIMILQDNQNLMKREIIELLQKHGIPSRLMPKAIYVANAWTETPSHKPIRNEIFASRKVLK
jgi:O-succinylbenzoic acid--CoA ligase